MHHVTKMGFLPGRAVGRSNNLVGIIPPPLLVEIGLTDLSKSEGLGPHGPPASTALLGKSAQCATQKYRISSYSFLRNYSFLNLEIVANSNSCRNISIFYLIN